MCGAKMRTSMQLRCPCHVPRCWRSCLHLVWPARVRVRDGRPAHVWLARFWGLLCALGYADPSICGGDAQRRVSLSSASNPGSRTVEGPKLLHVWRAHPCCRQASRRKCIDTKGRVCLGPCCFAVRLLWREGRPHRKKELTTLVAGRQCLKPEMIHVW